jgi:type II secretory pathway pseudopilin PulG
MKWSNQHGRRARAFSLIEIMVSVTLLSLIVIGLLAVFNHVQRALRLAHSQTDVFEGARAVVDILTRDLQELRATEDTNAMSVYAVDIGSYNVPNIGATVRTNIFQDLFMITRQNDEWSAIGYFLDQRSAGVATLYRYSTNGPWHGTNYTTDYLTNWWRTFRAAVTNNNIVVHRVLDGVVHFQARAYDAKGRPHDSTWLEDIYVPELTNNITRGRKYDGNWITNEYLPDLDANVAAAQNGFAFKGDFLPAFIEIEVGILEPQSTRVYNSMLDVNPPAALNYLRNQSGKMHLFRQRIPVRNHLKPEGLY